MCMYMCMYVCTCFYTYMHISIQCRPSSVSTPLKHKCTCTDTYAHVHAYTRCFPQHADPFSADVYIHMAICTLICYTCAHS